MSFAEQLLKAYFNYIYNPVYDATTARLHHYHELQAKCISLLGLNDGDKVLCVGVGTGNEIMGISQANCSVEIVGIDYSTTALQKARRKARNSGRPVDLRTMDAQQLQFPNGSFDRVICFHVMDFVPDCQRVSSEIMRVLKHGGQFLITYPSKKEGTKLAFNLLKDGIGCKTSRRRYFMELMMLLTLGAVYLPLLFRPGRKEYSREQLRDMFFTLSTEMFHIEEDPVYQDFIVYGRKLGGGKIINATRG